MMRLISSICMTLGWRAASTISAQRNILINDLILIKQLVLEKEPGAGSKLDEDEWGTALRDLFAAAVDRTASVQVVAGITASDDEWSRTLLCVLGGTSAEKEVYTPVWWTTRITFAYLQAFIGLSWMVVSNPLVWQGLPAYWTGRHGHARRCVTMVLLWPDCAYIHFELRRVGYLTIGGSGCSSCRRRQ
eukprot:TRINITY_DN47464_c0_g1_i1.p1 TRINITY_DN47464_c0_g1~~TRINITY_DN47464_c0_g1_i1.p1  ORF type:complete len:189 (+),score=20.35 TRINITY_DN47464_c0_g1_i1:3-569(+)